MPLPSSFWDEPQDQIEFMVSFIKLSLFDRVHRITFWTNDEGHPFTVERDEKRFSWGDVHKTEQKYLLGVAWEHTPGGLYLDQSAFRVGFVAFSLVSIQRLRALHRNHPLTCNDVIIDKMNVEAKITAIHRDANRGKSPHIVNMNNIANRIMGGDRVSGVVQPRICAWDNLGVQDG